MINDRIELKQIICKG